MPTLLTAILMAATALSSQTQNPQRTPAAAQTRQDYRPTEDEAELIRLSRDWMQAAVVRRDEARLAELMDPAFTLQILDASRAPQPLEEWRKTLRGRLKDVTFEFLSISARVFEETGVVYSTFRWSGQMDGAPFKDAGVLVDVWRKRDGRWRVVARRSAGQQVLAEVSKSLVGF